MKEDVRRAFDDLAGEPHPSLRASVRARLAGGPPAEPPRAWRMVVGTVLALGIAGLVLVVAVGLQPRGAGVTTPAATATSTPAAPPTWTPTGATPSPVASPTYAQVACPSPQAFSGGAAGMATVTDVRVGTTATYDRFVIQFDGPVPSYSVTPQSSTTFTQDPTGQSLPLQGTAGVRIVVHGASNTTPSGAQRYSGPTDLSPDYPYLREARQLGDFERVYSWGLGLSQPACLKVSVFTGPDRLVVDVLKP